MELKFSEFGESNKSLKYELGSFKDSVSHMCLAGTKITFDPFDML